MGGVLKQYQVVTSPAGWPAQKVTLQQLTDAAEKANVIAGGGVLERLGQESLIRIHGPGPDAARRSTRRRSPGASPRAVLHPATWPRSVFGGPVRRGDGSVRVERRTATLGPAGRPSSWPCRSSRTPTR